MTGALKRFAAEGAWGVSPHLIPHRSLHAISGTVSLALKMHGPNFGVGGGPRAAAEVLLSAAAMLTCRKLPGVWVVLTAQDPEGPPDEAGRHAPGTCFAALALALVPAQPGWPGIRLRLTHGEAEVLSNGRRRNVSEAADFDLFHLHHLLSLVARPHPAPVAVTQPLDAVPGYVSRLELSREAGEGVDLPTAMHWPAEATVAFRVARPQPAPVPAEAQR
jgi:hypothetical protein